MSDASNGPDKPATPDVDISTRAIPRSTWLFVAVTAAVIVGSAVAWILLGKLPVPQWAQWAFVVFGVPLAFAGWKFWDFCASYGIFTWGRLVHQPARAMARGDAVAAEAAYAKALDRAKQFGRNDHRRGLMLGDLAIYAKNQGRYPETRALYEESAAILAQQVAREPIHYLNVLNGYAFCLIDLKDYEAAQRTLETALETTDVVRKNEANKVFALLGNNASKLPLIQFFLHLNLAYLFLEVHELAEAEVRLRAAEALLPTLSSSEQASWRDYCIAIRALWEIESGRFTEAARKVAEARNPDHPRCLRVRAKLHLERKEFAEAEQVSRKYQDEERRFGTLHRPELLKPTLDLAEALFGQAMHDDAFASLEEARAIVADFALPADYAWRKALATWLQRAKDLGRSELAASLEKELAQVFVTPMQAITILEKFRIQPPGLNGG